MVQHKKCYDSWKILKSVSPTRSCNIFWNFCFDNCQIILVLNVNATNSNDLVSKKAHYIRSLECVNKVIPMKNNKEYREVNKEIIIEKNKDYRKKI